MILRRACLPETLKDNYFDFHWSQKKLWALELPVCQMKVSELEWQLQLPVWGSHPPEHLYDRRPLDVLNRLGAFPAEKSRILSADLSFPLHAMEWKGRPLILDGFHRLAKAKLLRLAEIPVKLVGREKIPSLTPSLEPPEGFLRFEVERRKPRDKVLAYVFAGDDVLVFLHRDHPEAGLQVPAGTVETGEDLFLAVRRELEEESGLRLENPTFQGRYPWFHPDRLELHWRHVFTFHVRSSARRWEHRVEGKGEDEGLFFLYDWMPWQRARVELAANQGDYLLGP